MEAAPLLLKPWALGPLGMRLRSCAGMKACPAGALAIVVATQLAADMSGASQRLLEARLRLLQALKGPLADEEAAAKLPRECLAKLPVFNCMQWLCVPRLLQNVPIVNRSKIL